MTVLDALQATLADEHAALYTYGVLGARTSQATAPVLFETLTAGYRRHRARRDQLRPMVRDAGGDPGRRRGGVRPRRPLLRPPQIERPRRTSRPQRRGAARAGRAVDGSVRELGAHRGDVVGGVALQPATPRRAGAPERPGRTAGPPRAHRALTQAAARGLAFRGSPEILPKAEDADRWAGQHHPVLAQCGGGGADMHNHAFDPPDAKAGSTCMFLQRTKLQKCHAQDVAAPPQERRAGVRRPGPRARRVIAASGSPSVWPTWSAGIG